MFWSPNVPVSTAAQYWPGKAYVDIVGIDCYPSSPLSSTAFSDCYSSFYHTYSESYNLPFAIGETGYGGSGGNDAWLSQIVGQDMCDYPNYIAASWFEYEKEGDFRIVMGSSSTLAETKSLLFDNSGTGTRGCSGSGGGSTTYPVDTCTWG
jgi:beta-mannanase